VASPHPNQLTMSPAHHSGVSPTYNPRAFQPSPVNTPILDRLTTPVLSAPSFFSSLLLTSNRLTSCPWLHQAGLISIISFLISTISFLVSMVSSLLQSVLGKSWSMGSRLTPGSTSRVTTAPGCRLLLVLVRVALFCSGCCHCAYAVN
jgi:hypothetical protein